MKTKIKFYPEEKNDFNDFGENLLGEQNNSKFLNICGNN